MSGGLSDFETVMYSNSRVMLNYRKSESKQTFKKGRSEYEQAPSLTGVVLRSQAI